MKINKKYLYFIILAFFIALIFNNQSDSKATSVSYNQFVMDLKSRKIQKLDIQNSYTRSQDIYYKFDKNSNVEGALIGIGFILTLMFLRSAVSSIVLFSGRTIRVELLPALVHNTFIGKWFFPAGIWVTHVLSNRSW